jgi:hypothetical protein
MPRWACLVAPNDADDRLDRGHREPPLQENRHVKNACFMVEVGGSDSGVSHSRPEEKELLTALKFPLRAWDPF